MEQIKADFRDMVMQCRDCGCGFVVRAGEQEWYFKKGLAIPKRCPECRQQRRFQSEAQK